MRNSTGPGSWANGSGVMPVLRRARWSRRVVVPPPASCLLWGVAARRREPQRSPLLVPKATVLSTGQAHLFTPAHHDVAPTLGRGTHGHARQSREHGAADGGPRR